MTADRVLAVLECVAVQPRPVSARKLRGAADLWRVRAGDYRVVYAIDDTQRMIDVRVIRHRKEEAALSSACDLNHTSAVWQ
ncbi:MAG: type II toxin-antitoxin system RelE/ParE family toxin [Acidobacteria bacterium]|nr:type II toxin-antitoxin system RelE/ParE family toxin [Acidobacteriota bacterium]